MLGRTAFDVLIGGSFGSLGALLSVLTRSREIRMDSAAGPLVHYLEGSARVVVGMAGAFLVVLAIKANLVLGIAANAEVYGTSLLAVLCVVAGASERLVPSLIRYVEDSVTPTKASKAQQQAHLSNK